MKTLKLEEFTDEEKVEASKDGRLVLDRAITEWKLYLMGQLIDPSEEIHDGETVDHLIGSLRIHAVTRIIENRIHAGDVTLDRGKELLESILADPFDTGTMLLMAQAATEK